MAQKYSDDTKELELMRDLLAERTPYDERNLAYVENDGFERTTTITILNTPYFVVYQDWWAVLEDDEVLVEAEKLSVIIDTVKYLGEGQ